MPEPPSEHDIRELLSRPDAYPEPPGSVEVIETHISVVFLAGDRVLKVKKPVRFPFLDYSTPQMRLAACRDEIDLNRRLAPDTYLRVAAITREGDGSLALGGDGEAVEHAVEMRRLPEDRMLDRVLDDGKLRGAEIEGLLDRLVAFYDTARRGEEVDRLGSPEAVEGNVRENLTTLVPAEHGLPEALFLRVRSSQCQFVVLGREVLRARVRDGRVCEGHGDLRAEHVCLLDPPVVFDCVEFSLAFRAADVVSEIAFLSMDCDFLGHGHLARRLFEGYRARSRDPASWALFRFYEAYRAVVRAKVEALRSDQTSGPEAREHLDRARRYLQLASYYALEYHRPLLVVVMGASGTGKSTLARGLADALGAEVVSTDDVRQELFGTSHAEQGYGEGIYTPENVERVYAEQLARAERLLTEAVTVILDGTFRTPSKRQSVRECGNRVGVPIRFFRCACDTEVARERIAARLEAGASASEARPEFHDRQLAELEIPPEERPDLVPVDTGGAPEAAVEAVIRDLARG